MASKIFWPISFFISTKEEVRIKQFKIFLDKLLPAANFWCAYPTVDKRNKTCDLFLIKTFTIALFYKDMN